MMLIPVRTACCGFLTALLLLVAPDSGIARAEAFAGEKAVVDRGSEVRDAQLMLSDAAFADTNVQLNDGPNGVPGAGRKYHPGHYVDLLRYQVFSNADKYLIPSLKPGVAGVQMRYLWRDFEIKPDQYDFSRIESDLKLLASRKMQLIVEVSDKTFKDEQPLPDYLASYMLPNRNGGYTAARWKPYVIERWVKLVQAMGKQFDSNPYFEGVATAESAPSLDNDVLTANGYTPEIYRDALISMLQGTAAAFPTSRVFWTMNFFPMRQDYIAQVASAVAPYGVAIGGPDILPDSPSIKRLAYPFYDQFQGRAPLFCSVMPNSYRHLHKSKSSTKYWTMEELYKFAREKLHLNYMLWTYVAAPKPRDAYDIDDAFPVMKRHPVINRGDFGSAVPDVRMLHE